MGNYHPYYYYNNYNNNNNNSHPNNINTSNFYETRFVICPHVVGYYKE
jgi:hypothetical protein